MEPVSAIELSVLKYNVDEGKAFPLARRRGVFVLDFTPPLLPL